MRNGFRCDESHRRVSEDQLYWYGDLTQPGNTEGAMTLLGIGVTRSRSLPNWSKLHALFAEWSQRIRSRYELEQLNERDLADMGLTPLDAFNEAQKPFWEP